MLKVKVYTGVLLKGKTDYACPGCGIQGAFFMKQDNVCEYCKQILPDIKNLIENTIARISWHFYHSME